MALLTYCIACVYTSRLPLKIQGGCTTYAEHWPQNIEIKSVLDALASVLMHDPTHTIVHASIKGKLPTMLIGKAGIPPGFHIRVKEKVNLTIIIIKP